MIIEVTNRERFYREIQAFIENIAEFEIESNDVLIQIIY